MVVKILKDTAFFTTRDPFVKKSTEPLVFSFDGAKEGCVASFTTEDNVTYYRDITDGACQLNAAHLKGGIDIRIKMPSSNGNKPQEWVCESIVLTTTPGGYQLVSVSEKSIRQNYLNCLVEINNLRDVNASLEKRIEKLEILVEKMKGYEL